MIGLIPRIGFHKIVFLINVDITEASTFRSADQAEKALLRSTLQGIVSSLHAKCLRIAGLYFGSVILIIGGKVYASKTYVRSAV